VKENSNTDHPVSVSTSDSESSHHITADEFSPILRQELAQKALDAYADYKVHRQALEVFNKDGFQGLKNWARST
jgi:uncharacterized protein with ATP-grasp and redox domains